MSYKFEEGKDVIIDAVITKIKHSMSGITLVYVPNLLSNYTVQWLWKI